MNRRRFLRNAALTGLPLLAGNPLSARMGRALEQLISPDSDRILVLIELAGGNDGLNTLVPIDQLDNLMAVRRNITLPRAKLLPVNDTLGLHPAAAGLRNLYDDGKMLAVQSVGYPDQNRSHFRSIDIWTSASEADQFVSSGWLGRRFADVHPDYPEGFPNEASPHPLALVMGNQVSQTCQGPGTNYSIAINNPYNLLTLGGANDEPLPTTPYGNELGYLRTSIAQANAYGAVVQETINQGANTAEYPDTNLAERLRRVAQLIDGGMQTHVYVVSLGGFDTHGDQVQDGDPTTGEHAQLLQTLGDAMQAFHRDIDALGHGDRVVSMTFSEFGRRIRSNESFGTDHGSAAPLFLMGNCLQAGILGTNPAIARDAGDGEGVPMQYDFRDVYGTVLQDWFELEPTAVETVLGRSHVRLPLFSACGTTSTDDDRILREANVRVFPNPFANGSTLSFTGTGVAVEISISDALGKLVQSPIHLGPVRGPQRLPIDLGGRPGGVYFLRIRMGSAVQSHRLVKR